jgi:peptide/nickel transport system ATP-binding protein
LADRIVVLKGGRMVETGDAATLLQKPSTEYTRSLLAAARPLVRAPGQAEAATVLAVEGIHAGYGRVRDGMAAIPILTDVSFGLDKGSALGIIGESGSGKSTLARVIAGLLPASAGSIRLEGETLAPAIGGRSREQLRQIQLVFQNADTALNPVQTVRETIGRPLAFYHGIRGSAADARVNELLETIQLQPAFAERRTAELSGGQKQRVNLARALAAEPSVLLCDEVTSALDTVVGAAILDLIDGLRRQLGIATVFISHDISTVRAFCDEMLVLYSGRPVETCSKAAFSAPNHHPYTELLIDSVPDLDPRWLESRGAQRVAALVDASHDNALCAFLPRCPAAIRGQCDSLPPPQAIVGTQRILCHRLSDAALAQSEL